MKTTFLIFAVLFGGSVVSAQTVLEIASIRADVGAINANVKSYTTSTKDLSGLSTEGGKAVYYVSGRGLKKITATIYGETGRSTLEFFYSGEELIFAFRTVYKYDTQIGIKPPPKVVKTEEARLYRHGDRTIRLMSGKVVLKPDSIEFEELERELIETSDHIKMLYHP